MVLNPISTALITTRLSQFYSRARVCVSCARESRQRSPPVRPDVSNDARVDNKADLPSGRQDPEIQRQMDEVDRHRETVQKMSRKIIELHTKVYATLYATVCVAKAVINHAKRLEETTIR